MAQPHSQTQQRPSFPQPSPSYPMPQYPPQSSRPSFNPQSPSTPGLTYTSPSPQPQFSPTFSNQAPPAKKPRLSEDAPSPFSQPVGTPQAGSPVNGQVNGVSNLMQTRPNPMPPPQQPVIKREERDSDGNVFRNGTTEMNLQMPPTHGQMPNTLSPHLGAHASIPAGESIPRPISNMMFPNSTQPIVKQEERNARFQERQDWEEARHSQHELWDPFLYGGTLNEKIKLIAHRSNLVEPQSGVLVNTQKNQPAPIVRVNGHEGATRVIRDGQSILDTKDKAERLNELVKLLSLSARARLTGLVQTAARLASERREHSQGRIPNDWTDIAIKSKTKISDIEAISSPTASTGMKRTHSQANSEADSTALEKAVVHPVVSQFARFSSQEFKAEVARQAKRRKRNEVLTAQENEASAVAQQEAIDAMSLDNDKKTSKKDRRMAESKMSEQQQHASTNEAARMATGIFGKFGKKNKTYSWLNKGGDSAASTRPTSAAATPARAASVAPAKDKPQEARKGPQLGDFDEQSDAGIQGRDLLLVLESDGRAARSYVKGSSNVDDMPPA